MDREGKGIGGRERGSGKGGGVEEIGGGGGGEWDVKGMRRGRGKVVEREGEKGSQVGNCKG